MSVTSIANREVPSERILPAMRRWVFLTLVWLVLGAMVNVGVAWWASREEVIEQNRRFSIDPPTVWLPGADGGVTILTRRTSYPWRVAVTLTWPDPVPDGWPAIPDYVGQEDGLGWTNFIAVGLGASPQLVSFSHYGWPMASLRGWSTTLGPSQPSHSLCLDVPYRLRNAFPNGWLPVIPVWPGVLVNSVVYAVPVAMLWLALGAVRRWRRMRANLCVRCGYDLRGLAAQGACPECGKVSRSKT